MKKTHPALFRRHLPGVLPNSLLPAALIVALLPACVMTREEGLQMESDLRAVEQEIAVARLEQKRKEADLAERVKAAEQRMAKVDTALQAADRTARQADADFYLKMDELVAQVQRQSGRLDEIEHRLQQLEQGAPSSSSRPGGTSPGVADAAGGDSSAGTATPDAAPEDKLPEDKRELYDLAKQRYDAGEHDAARALFKTFLGRHPDDALLSDNALFWTAESYYRENTFDKAILTYQEVINKHPKSDKLDAALYKIGRSFEALGLKQDATLFYEDLVAKYPKSKLVPDAKKRIKANRSKRKKKGRRRSR